MTSSKLALYRYLLLTFFFACQDIFCDYALGIPEQFALLNAVCPKHLDSTTYLLCAEHFADEIQDQTFLTMCRYIMAIHFAVSQKLTNFAINI